MIKKHQEIVLNIEKNKFYEIGSGTFDGEEILVRGALKGQKVSARVTKFKNGINAKLLEVVEHADYEISPACGQFENGCGGCVFQNITLAKEAELKQEMLAGLLADAGYELSAFYPALSTDAYRNKMEFSFGDDEKGGKLKLGMRKRGNYYSVSDASSCLIAPADFGKIVNKTAEFFAGNDISFFHRGSGQGLLRNLVLRKSFAENKILVNLIISEEQVSGILSGYADELLKLELSGEISGIICTVCTARSDSVKADKTSLLYGQEYLYEEIMGLRFKISPFSFFQTNTDGASRLYSGLLDFLGDISGKVAFDLYCGTGTIAALLAGNAKKVYGIELVEEAVLAARENAAINKLTNCTFLAGDVLKVLSELSEKPDIIVIDPPREGLHPKALANVISLGAEKIIYVSCKPTSLVRDLAVLCESGYEAERIAGYDMFPRTGHVETVVLLSKLKSSKSIEVKIDLDEVDLTKSESKATYDEVKAYVLDKYGFKVSQLYIAQVKRKHGIIERENYNTGESKAKVPQVPEDKEKAIEDALRYFKMIDE